MLNARLRLAGVDTSSLRSVSCAQRCRAVPKDILGTLVQQSTSVIEVLAKLALPTQGRAHRELTKRIRHLGLDISHFAGKAWARGKTHKTSTGVARSRDAIRNRDEEVFIENGPHIGGPKLTKRLLARGWTYACAWCGINAWRGESLVLHLDRVNGIHNDNRLTNLRWLCPNCHSQTSTYANRRRSTAASVL
jgi:hypothetical protein